MGLVGTGGGVRAEPAEPPRRGGRRCPAHHRAGVVAGLVLVVLLLTGLALSGLGPGTAPSTGGPGAGGGTGAGGTGTQQAAQRLLSAHAEALVQRDRQAFLSDLDPDVTAVRDQQAAVFDAVAQVPLAAWSYDVQASARPTSGAAGDVVLRVVRSYRLQGVDVAPLRQEQDVTLARHDGRWWIDALSPTDGHRDLWDLGPVHVVRTDRALVLGTADEASLRHVADLADGAAEEVDAVWGTGWPRRTVFLVPADQAGLAALLGRQDETGLDQIAAFTTGDGGADRSAPSTDRVLVSPAGLERLRDVGRRVVLAHEMTHVATRWQAVADPPLWLGEGFADFVAYAGAARTGGDAGTSAAGDVSPQVVAADLLGQVRQGDGPTDLPGPSAFDPAAGDVTSAYSQAWLAARSLAQEYGTDALVRLYRAVTGHVASDGAPAVAPQPLPVALEQVLGTDRATVVARWRDELARLAAAG